MKRYILALLIGLAFGSASAQDSLQAVRMSLDSCLRYALQHNMQVASARLGSENAEAALTGAKLRFLPSVSASASQGWTYADQTSSSTHYGIDGSLTLFSGLNNVRSLQQSRVAANQSMLKVEQMANTVSAQVVQAYLTILMNQERLSFQQEVLATSRQQAEEGEVKYQVGRILESDYLLLEANYTTAQAEIENTRLTIEENLSSLLTLIGMDPTAKFEVVRAADTLPAAAHSLMPYDTLMAQARRAMPDWQIAELEVQSARYGVGIARSSFMPTVSLGAGYGGQHAEAGTAIATSDFTHSGSVSLGVNIPLFNRGTSLTQLKQSKIALREAELQYQQTMLDLTDAIDQAYLAAGQALNRYRASEAMAEAYHASYMVYVLKYAQGTVTTVEMLQQSDKYLSAYNDYLQNKYSYLLAEKQLDIYTGHDVNL